MIVWLASYPRSGNSLVRTILRQSFGLFSYSMYNDVHDLGASKDRARLVGHVSYSMSWDRFYQIASAKRRYVFVKTHDPPFDDAPAIYIVRDGRSAIVSYRHYFNTFGNRQVSLLDVVLGHTHFGSWSEHIERWQPERRAGTLLLRYEEIVADPDAAVAAIADRFGISALKPFRNPFDHQRQEFPEFFRRGRTDPELKEFDRTAVQLFSCLHGAMMSRLGYRSSWGDGPDALRQFILQQRDLRRKREKELGAKANELETHKKAQAELCKELGAKANELETHKKAQAELCKELGAKANELRQTQTQLAEIETSTSFQVGRAFVDALVRPFPGVLVFPSRLARIALHRKQKRERKLQEALQHVEGQVQQAGRQSVISVGDGGISRAASEAAAWPRALERLGIPDAALLHQSPYDRGLRVYRHEDRVYKIAMRPLLESSSRRARDLRGEFDLLRRNRGVRGLPEAIDFHRAGDVEAAAYAAVDGTVLDQLQPGWGTALSVLSQLAAILARLSLRGISHNDILPQNVLVGEDGLVYLLDFDQATTGSIYRAAIRNYLGLRIGVHPVFGSWTTVLKTLLKKLLSTSVARATGRLRSWRSHEATGELPRSVQPDRVLPTLAADASEAVKLLHRAWRLGQKSDANWPGAGVAYYSIEFEGYRFPGERPWSHRWECLRQIIDYKGKRILELGCNMGLLSCSLLREAGASAALCVDGDAEILEAARLVAGAYGVEPEFRRLSFDELADWESNLAPFRPDVVFALSVLNWIEDKDRFIRFLGRFPEVVFEGHDELGAEMERFRRVGFDRIAVVGVSERDRAILHCRKSAAETHVAPGAASVASAGGTISCVITSYNNSDYLKQAVESVVAQTKPVDEIIVADDASTDGSQDLIRSLAAEHQNIRIILRERNLGVARNRDFAIREANGELVTWLDGDDFFYNNKTEMELRALDTVADAVAISNIDIVGVNGNVLNYRDVSPFSGTSKEEALEILACRRGGLPRHMLMAKKIYEEVGGIKSKFHLYEDWDLDMRLAARPVRWVWSGCVGYGYRSTGGGLSTVSVREHHKATRAVLEENRAVLEGALGPDTYRRAIEIVCPTTLGLPAPSRFRVIQRKTRRSLRQLAKRAFDAEPVSWGGF